MSLTQRSVWESIYSRETETSEWYYDLDAILLQSLIESTRIKDVEIVLNCGCGSHLIPMLRFCPVVINFDFAMSIVNQLHIKDELVGRNSEVLVADARHLPFADGSFDVLIEKGLFDSMTSDSKTQIRMAESLLNEYWRLLRPNGAAIILSIFGPNGEDKDMLGLLSHPLLRVEYQHMLRCPAEIPTQDFCFIYTCFKVE